MKTMFYEFLVLCTLAFCISRCGGNDPQPQPTPNPEDKPGVTQIGTPAQPEHAYSWKCTGTAKLSDPNVAQPYVTVKKTTTCTVTATTKCGQAKSSVVVHAVKVVNGALVEQTE